MEFRGFGKNSGPSTPPRGQTPFGHFTRPPSPSPSPSPPLSTTPRSSDIPSGNKSYLVPYRAQSPPMVLQNNLYVGGEHPTEFQQSSDIPSGNKSYLVPYRAQSPPAVFQNNLYGGGEHPGVIAQQRPFPSSVWGNKSKPSTYNSTPTPPGQDGVSSVYTRGATFQPGQVFQTRQEDVPLPRRTRSPVLSSAGGASPENTFFPSAGHRRPLIDYRDLDAPEAMPSPPLSSEGSFSSRNASRPFVGTQRPSSPMLANQSKSSYNSPSLVQEGMPSVLTTRETYPSGRTLHSKPGDIPPTKRTRSPTPPSTGGDFSENSVFDSDGLKRAPDSHSHRHSSVSGQTNNVEVAADKPVHFQAVKRTKLPILSSSDQVFQENLDSAQETERELDAKAKRLARFKDEISQPIQSHSTTRTQKVPAKKQHQPTLEKKKFSEDPTMDVTGDFDGDNVLLDYEGMGSSNSIVGLCADMCPESERAERERKGDLDQYERVDGDRNLTSEFLAVKKYTRTAEREADLIRPMPILQKTMDYLLNLLDQPYDDRWLRLYNFLWDRMRAIRMDLRMQHIFNLQAITMLEQMIRLHIIAMHELCEYTKGEGFAEGFDAHLNIEQMNKTSVELFQLYDDHRKKGKHVPSEREFRGYYALLKLDKHPGYKVEPAELSLDLAKMTPEMRQTPEVLFARDVARACRTGNFIAFFRLARKASYLQACLMHAHFSKLRTQALASLHSGLQVNQGIPISHVAKWLGMEEEDIGILLEHHGFSVKEFEEPYMVKEYTFLNVDNDFPVKRSKLVDRKRSMMIVSDVSFPSLSELHATEEVTEFQLKKDPDPMPTPLQTFSPVNTMQPHYEETHDLGVILSPKGSMQKPMYKISTNLLTPDVKTTEHEIQLAPANPLVLDFSNSSPEHNQSRVESAQKPLYNPVFRNSFGKTMKHDYKETAPITLETAEEERAPDPPLDSIVHSLISEPMFTEDLEDEEPTGIMEEDETDEVTTSYYDKEVAEAKIKLILRIWKRRTAKKKELRVNKQLAANAALSLLSLGPPIWQYEVQSGNHGMFNIDHVMSERHEIQERSWSVLNPSDVVAAKLAEKNPDSKCLCWKMVLCSQNEAATSAAGSWLHSKLIPAENDSDDLLVSSPGLAIWKSWFPSQSGVDTCCLSVIKSTTFNDMDKSVTGASAVLFLLSEHIPIEIQKNRLHDIVMLLPSGSRLPLLILSCSGKDESDSSAIAKDLGLNEIDQSKVIKFDISFLKDNEMKRLDGFFSNEHLGEGLEWLASESPPQIVISETKTRELVQSHLNYTLEALDETNIHKIGPNHCISAFNEALDRSMMEIAAAAHANPTGWPCPEIGLLDESNDVYKIAAWYLPSIGWSSPSRIEKLICVLKDSKLPILEDDTSWLSKGLNIGGDDIENYKVRLENCLINYLTVSNQMMGAALAQKEANTMVQKCTRLELQNATYYIMPKWVHIFRRIFSWRLTNLTSSEVSSTYVLVGKDFSAPGNFESGFGTFLPPYVVDPSLDELVEVGYHELGSNDMEYDDFRPVLLPMASSDANVQSSKDNLVLMENEEKSSQNNILTNYDISTTEANEDGGQMMYTTNATTEADKLSELLEKCNIMQNLIDKKLSIYF